MTADEARLPLLAEKLLSLPIHPNLLAYCSRTDLLALVNQDEQVDVYRLSGQRAFNVKRKGPSISVVGLEWIRDGKCLAIALSSGNVDIVSGETGKIVHHGGDDPFATGASGSRPEPAAISCLGWGTTLTTGNNKSALTDKVKASRFPEDDQSTEDWFDKLNGASTSDLLGEDPVEHGSQTRDQALGDLPHKLAFLDVESVLPRLSPIPARANTGGRYDMFTTQAALDDYFNSMQGKDRSAAEVMVVGHRSGLVRLVIDDILQVDLPPRDDREDKDYLLYASHSQSPCHALLRGRTERDDVEPENSKGINSYHGLSLGLFDIPLLSSGGSHLHLIVSKTAQIRDLCNYISYSIICAKSDWTTNTNLPSRFMENVNETLEEKGEGTLEQNLFHLAMTGNFSPTMLEWLRDELAERGHKRWDHAMTTLYIELNKIFQTNLLPVLERCIVVATNLRGLARYYEGSKKFDVSPAAFTKIIDALCNLQLLVHEAIQILGEEQRQFRAFSKWLRHEIDLAAADPESISAKDMAEREAPNLDYPRILAYLEGGMTKSRLKPIVHAQIEEGEALPVDKKELVKAIHEARKGTAERKDLLSLQTLSSSLNISCKAAHAQILRWKNSASSSIEEVELEPGPISSAFDMKMVCVSPNVFKTIILAVPENERNKISVHSITKDATPSTSKKHWRIVDFPADALIRSVAFLDDTDFLVLLSLPESSPLHSPSSPSPVTGGQTRIFHLLRLPYAVSSQGIVDAIVDLRDERVCAGYLVHTFGVPTATDNDVGSGGSGGSGGAKKPEKVARMFVPGKIVVGGKKGGRVAVVVEEGGMAWRVLDLEEGSRVAREEDESEVGVDDDDGMLTD